MDRIERAKQFMPFAALHGYGEVVHKKEINKVSRRNLSNDELDELNGIFLQIKKGIIVHAEYFSHDGYIQIDGVVSEINHTERFVKIVKTKIFFDDLYKIRIIK